MKEKKFIVHHADVYGISVLSRCSDDVLFDTFSYLKDKFHSRKSLKLARRIFRRRLKIKDEYVQNLQTV